MSQQKLLEKMRFQLRRSLRDQVKPAWMVLDGPTMDRKRSYISLA